MPADLFARDPFTSWTDADFAAFERLMPCYIGRREELADDLRSDPVSLRDVEEGVAAAYMADHAARDAVGSWDGVPY